MYCTGLCAGLSVRQRFPTHWQHACVEVGGRSSALRFRRIMTADDAATTAKSGRAGGRSAILLGRGNVRARQSTCCRSSAEPANLRCSPRRWTERVRASSAWLSCRARRAWARPVWRPRSALAALRAPSPSRPARIDGVRRRRTAYGSKRSTDTFALCPPTRCGACAEGRSRRSRRSCLPSDRLQVYRSASPGAEGFSRRSWSSSIERVVAAPSSCCSMTCTWRTRHRGKHCAIWRGVFPRRRSGLSRRFVPGNCTRISLPGRSCRGSRRTVS